MDERLPDVILPDGRRMRPIAGGCGGKSTTVNNTTTTPGGSESGGGGEQSTHSDFTTTPILMDQAKKLADAFAGPAADWITQARPWIANAQTGYNQIGSKMPDLQLSGADLAKTFNLGDPTLANQATASLGDILGGRYDPVKNPQGYTAAFNAMADPVMENYNRNLRPAVNAEFAKGGDFMSSGRTGQQAQLASDVNRGLATSGEQLFSDRDKMSLQATLGGLGLAPSIANLPQQQAQALLAFQALPTQLQTELLNSLVGGYRNLDSASAFPFQVGAELMRSFPVGSHTVGDNITNSTFANMQVPLGPTTSQSATTLPPASTLQTILGGINTGSNIAGNLYPYLQYLGS